MSMGEAYIRVDIGNVFSKKEVEKLDAIFGQKWFFTTDVHRTGRDNEGGSPMIRFFKTSNGEVFKVIGQSGEPTTDGVVSVETIRTRLAEDLPIL